MNGDTNKVQILQTQLSLQPTLNTIGVIKTSSQDVSPTLHSLQNQQFIPTSYDMDFTSNFSPLTTQFSFELPSPSSTHRIHLSEQSKEIEEQEPETRKRDLGDLLLYDFQSWQLCSKS